VRREGNRLLGQKPWAPSFELFPQSQTSFLSGTRSLEAAFVPEKPGYPGQLLLRDLDSDRISYGTKISTHAPTQGAILKSDPDLAEDYTGQYRSSDGTVLIIRHQDGNFMLQTGVVNLGNLDLENLMPGSESLFFGQTAPIAVTFLRDSRGKISGLIRHLYEEHSRYVKFSSAPVGIGAEPDGFLGVWGGMVIVNEKNEIPIIVKIHRLNGSYQASLDFPGKSLKDLPSKTSVLVGPSSLFLAFQVYGRRATLEAVLNDGATELAGTWREGQSTFPVALKRTTPKTAKNK
jgi:hypothetical protein